MNQKIVSVLKGVFGLFALQNLGQALSFLDKSVSQTTRNTSIVNIILGLVFLYLAFTLQNELQKHSVFVKSTVWIAVVYTLIRALWVGSPIVWLALYLIVGIYLLVNLSKATKPELPPAPPASPMIS